MSRHSIQIRFIRKLLDEYDEYDPCTDDVMSIKRVEENSYIVVYMEKSKDGTVVDVMKYNNQQLLAYLYRAFWLTSMDEDPFESVRLFIPGFPTCLLSVPTLKQQIPYVLDIIINNCWSWPTAGIEVSGTTAGRQSTHTLFSSVRSPQEPAYDASGNDYAQ
jgi:hypothetical protein